MVPFFKPSYPGGLLETGGLLEVTKYLPFLIGLFLWLQATEIKLIKRILLSHLPAAIKTVILCLIPGSKVYQTLYLPVSQ